MARRSAAATRVQDESPEPPSSERPSDRFLAGLESASRVTFVSHVHPDPDSLGSMMGLAHLVETCLAKPTRLTRDGPISRAENRTMVDVLGLELLKVEALAWEEDEAVVMVDSQPDTGRHTFGPGCPLYAVLDHHATPGKRNGIPFVDVRDELGATCSLVTRYLIEQEVPIPPDVATALFYGIETEVSGYPREACPLDDRALQYLYPLADKDQLARIRNARLPQSYFECVLQALQSSFVYDRLIISWVNELPQPELAAEVCDFMIRFEEVDWAVCAGVYNEKLIISARSALPNAEAGEVLRSVVGRMGKAGGHDRRAGGMVPLASTASSAIEEVQGELRRRLLKALKIDEARGHIHLAFCFATIDAMSDASDYPPVPPRVLPVRPAPPPPPRGGSAWRVLFVLLLLGSLGLNVLLVCGGLALSGMTPADTDGAPIREKFHGGTTGATDKVAVVTVEGTIIEGLVTFAHKQIDRAASDKNVKAVVVRIESPGGSITASDDLHRRLTHLRDGTTPRYQSQGTAAKPLVVSMGNLAASGGYYIAMPAKKAGDEKKIFAEPTTITGSIGVYASFPDLHKLSDKYGIEMKMIKAGEIKGSGSMFHEMTPQERQPWDDMVTHAYDRFLGIVAEGRPLSKDQLAHEVVMKGDVAVKDNKGNPVKDADGKPTTMPFSRTRADGGIFTAEEAKEYGLVDVVGTVDDAIAEAARQAGLTKYRAIVYERPLTLLTALTGNASGQVPRTDVGKLLGSLGPRVWYLMPQAEVSGMLDPLRRE